VDNIIGTKEASGNFGQIARIIEETGDDFITWSGNDADTLSIMALGGYGVISVASHLVGKQINKIVSSYLAGDTAEAAAIHRHLVPLYDALFVISNPMPVKYALNYIGFEVGQPRPPLYEADEKTQALIQKTLKDYQIDLPCS
jgi:4-hydroxy-tetrahydrodipicolinate synthase